MSRRGAQDKPVRPSGYQILDFLADYFVVPIDLVIGFCVGDEMQKGLFRQLSFSRVN
jgi:hypothetical protein